jgi:hypothetical protein
MFEEPGFSMREWSTANWMFHAFNMGIYGHLDDGTLFLVHNWTPIMVVYGFYMIVVHLVLLVTRPTRSTARVHARRAVPAASPRAHAHC